jgi:hypothetical protein
MSLKEQVEYMQAAEVKLLLFNCMQVSVFPFERCCAAL